MTVLNPKYPRLCPGIQLVGLSVNTDEQLIAIHQVLINPLLLSSLPISSLIFVLLYALFCLLFDITHKISLYGHNMTQYD